MRRTRMKVIGALAVLTVVTAGCAGGVSSPAGLTSAAELAVNAARHGPPADQRAVDALGGSGSAGVDPAAATAQTRQQQAMLEGDIQFSVPSGTFQGQQSVQLSTSIANAQIRYTTDGTAPTAASPLYQGAITLQRTAQLRAQAFVDGAASGAMGTSVYVARTIDAEHDLPLVVLDAYGGGKPARDYRDVAVMVMDRQNSVASLGQQPAVATRGGFHLRGQSSSNFAKAPYRLEFWNNEDKDADYPVLGMPADSDWVLRGPFPDKTLIRDAFAYSIGRDMGLRAPRFAFVEVYLNLDAQPLAADDYQGVYLLVETLKNSPDRMNLQKLKKSDITEPAISGGYVMQFNALAAEPPILTCTRKPPSNACWSDLEVNDPDELQPEQLAWITDYIQRFHDSLRSANPSDPTTGYPAYIDVDSWVDRIVHNELAREPDAYIRSTYFFKDRQGKLVAGPLWDYDIGYAAYTGFGGATTTGWQFQPGFGSNTTDWFIRLMQDPAFAARAKTRWEALRTGIMSDAQLGARVTTLSAPLINAAQRNFTKWPILNQRVVGGFQTQVSQTWQQQLDIMRQWLIARTAWLDSSGWTPTATAPADAVPPPQLTAR
ncbi:CotH kinase family protein [Plantactinospora alkalitolerans]|nr:CotH kinase family protein [Plantactinospora alkalitolerans]